MRLCAWTSSAHGRIRPTLIGLLSTQTCVWMFLHLLHCESVAGVQYLLCACFVAWLASVLWSVCTPQWRAAGAGCSPFQPVLPAVHAPRHLQQQFRRNVAACWLGHVWCLWRAYASVLSAVHSSTTTSMLWCRPRCDCLGFSTLRTRTTWLAARRRGWQRATRWRPTVSERREGMMLVRQSLLHRRPGYHQGGNMGRAVCLLLHGHLC